MSLGKKVIIAILLWAITFFGILSLIISGSQNEPIEEEEAKQFYHAEFCEDCVPKLLANPVGNDYQTICIELCSIREINMRNKE